MNFDEIMEALKEFQGRDEYNQFIAGILNADNVNRYLDSKEGESLMRPRLDKHFNKSLETWKTNNLEKIISERVKELYPESDPKDNKIKELEQALAKIEADVTREKLTNKALTIANEKGLPVDLVSYFIGADEDTTLSNLELLEKVYTDSVSATVENKLKDNTYVPPKEDPEVMDGVTKAFMDLNPDLKISE